MYTLEYLYSKGRADRHVFHNDIVDIYTIYKELAKFFEKYS